MRDGPRNAPSYVCYVKRGSTRCLHTQLGPYPWAAIAAADAIDHPAQCKQFSLPGRILLCHRYAASCAQAIWTQPHAPIPRLLVWIQPQLPYPWRVRIQPAHPPIFAGGVHAAHRCPGSPLHSATVARIPTRASSRRTQFGVAAFSAAWRPLQPQLEPACMPTAPVTADTKSPSPGRESRCGPGSRCICRLPSALRVNTRRVGGVACVRGSACNGHRRPVCLWDDFPCGITAGAPVDVRVSVRASRVALIATQRDFVLPPCH